jgi:predicted ATPase
MTDNKELDINIALWGGSGTGKTTYLSALRVAMLRDTEGQWNINGRDDLQRGSSEFVATNTSNLLRGHFPPGTEGRGESVVCTISGILHLDTISTIFSMARYGTNRVNFDLYVKDYPGHTLLNSPHGDPFWDYLAECQGLIYLYDPLLDETEKTNYDYLQQAMDLVSTAVKKQQEMHQLPAILPHYIAVCVTKFDHPATFQRLHDADLVSLDATGTPHVPDGAAAFRLLADELVVNTLERSFRKDRIRYFVTSAVGFYTGPEGQVDLNDCYNIIHTTEGTRIRGEARPINVFEPLIWIASQKRYPQLVLATRRTLPVVQEHIRKLQAGFFAKLAELKDKIK